MHKTVRPWGVSAGKAHAGDNREEQRLFSILKHLNFLQKRSSYSGNLNTEAPGDSRNVRLKWEHASALFNPETSHYTQKRHLYT